MVVRSISETLVANLRATGKPEAIALAKRFENKQINEQDFIAQAGQFARQYSSDASGALARSVALHAPRGGFSMSKDAYRRIFGNPDRGARVVAVEELIRSGAINPTEVLKCTD